MLLVPTSRAAIFIRLVIVTLVMKWWQRVRSPFDPNRADDPQYLFSGGALLVGQIARVDPLGPKHAGELARAAYETLRERVLTLADYVAVFPTHGGGSACAAEVAGSRWTTLGFERKHNHIARMASAGFESFRAAISEGLPVAPAYYPSVRAINTKGASAASLGRLPFVREIEPNIVRIDPRPPHVFGAGHRPGELRPPAPIRAPRSWSARADARPWSGWSRRGRSPSSPCS